MGRPILYLLIGYPGAGKTTVAKIVHEATGAVHLWSDIERHKMFGNPTHSEAESKQLYDALNHRTDELLSEGKSVIFDTNFNFLADRQKLRRIAESHDAETVILWVCVPEATARQRAVDNQKRNGYHTRLTGEEFERFVGKLEAPDKTEKIIKIDGTKLDPQTVLRLLGQYDDADISVS